MLCCFTLCKWGIKPTMPHRERICPGGAMFSLFWACSLRKVKMEDKWASPPAPCSLCTSKRHQAPPPGEVLSSIGLVWGRGRAFCTDSLPTTQSLALAI